MYLIDTNVMMASSALSSSSRVSERAMPREIELRAVIYEWLRGFDLSDDGIVLDDLGLIREEYEKNLPFNYREQEYGLQVLQAKIDRCLVEYVPIEAVQADGKCIAVLAPDMELIVTHRNDRKWVAAAISAKEYLGVTPPIVFGAESDWFIARSKLEERGIRLLQLLPDNWFDG